MDVVVYAVRVLYELVLAFAMPLQGMVGGLLDGLDVVVWCTLFDAISCYVHCWLVKIDFCTILAHNECCLLSLLLQCLKRTVNLPICNVATSLTLVHQRRHDILHNGCL